MFHMNMKVIEPLNLNWCNGDVNGVAMIFEHKFNAYRVFMNYTEKTLCIQCQSCRFVVNGKVCYDDAVDIGFFENIDEPNMLRTMIECINEFEKTDLVFTKNE